MSEGEGWIQRVFGGKPGSQRAETIEQELAERERLIIEKQQVIGALELRIATLDTELQASARQSKLRELELGRQLDDAAAAHRALAAELERSESKRAAELAQARKQIDSVQAVVQAGREELSQIKGRLAAREAELAKKTEQLTDSEWRNQTLEGEVTRFRAEEPKQRALKSSLVALQRELEAARAERDAHGAARRGVEAADSEQVRELMNSQALAARRIEELETGIASTEQRLADREASATQLQEAVLELSRLSAGALHGTFGDALHLALELTARRGWRPAIDASRGPAEVVQQLQRRLALFGVVTDVRIDLSGPIVRGELRLSAACDTTEARALSRWAVAYAIECLNLALPAPLRLDELSNEAHACVFTASAAGGADASALAGTSTSGTRMIARAS